VVLLFLGSVSTVLLSAFHTLILPRGEIQMSDELREASQRMAQEAESAKAIPEGPDDRTFAEINNKLRSISDRVLRAYPGVEGGFYLENNLHRFAGYAFPTDDAKRPPPPLGKKGTAEKGSPADPERELAQLHPRGDDPPPKEAPFILLQVQHSLSGDYQFDARAIGPSRVAIATEPVGAARPAQAATWIMFRLTNPEDLGAQLRRYQVSTGLALGGIALAVALTFNLGRTLKRQRSDQERLREELRRSEHLASLGKLLAGVAHEVRNPLAGIRSTVQLWERLPDTARTPHSMQAVIRAVDRLNEIVSRLLYMSRSDSTE
jgi:two-component system sensor histidine kinase HydH